MRIFRDVIKKDIKKKTIKKKISISTKNTTNNSYHVFDLTTIDETITTTTQINNTSKNDDIIQTSPNQSKSTPEYIILDSDEEDNINNNLNQNTKSTFFIDRSSTANTSISQSALTSNEDYHNEDSKYAQLPSLNTSSSSIIRPILSKHQRRKKGNSTDSSIPLVSAIDRIIDHMDKSDTLDNNLKTTEQQNLLIKQIKKRKKKKKKKKLLTQPSIS